jgi:hypothetical protein
MIRLQFRIVVDGDELIKEQIPNYQGLEKQ